MASSTPPRPLFLCALCKENHPIRICPKFKPLSGHERYNVIKFNKYCISCFDPLHTYRNCPLKLKCMSCDGEHHTMLHEAPQLVKARPLSPQTKSTLEKLTFNCSTICLPTATVDIKREGNYNWTRRVRALINQSYPVTRIALSTVQRLGFEIIRKNDYEISEFRIRAHGQNKTFNCLVKALITNELPRKPYAGALELNIGGLCFENLIADIDPKSNELIEIELGADIYPDIGYNGTINIKVGKIVAQQTALGIIFTGPITNDW